jgi:hypothetical protein
MERFHRLLPPRLMMNRKLVLLLVVVLAIKMIMLALDSEPSFQFGDSSSYLGTALNKWIPPDRSFVYGFILRRIVVRPHSLLPLVVVQAILSGIASWMIGVCLMRYLRANFVLAALCSIGCALEPLQLMFERFVMTETMSVFALAVFMLLSFSYLKTGSLPTLALAQVVGVFLFSLRYSYLPLVLILSALLPLLLNPPSLFQLKIQDLRWSGRFAPVVLSLIISVGLSQLLLLGYRHLYGSLAHGPAEYSSQDGIFLVADMAPIIKPIDFPIAEKRDLVFRNLKFPLTDPEMRRSHRWLPGGLCEAIERVSGNGAEANRLARKTALRAMKRDPLGVLKLGAFTFGEFFNHERVKWNLELDQGRYVDPTPGDMEMLRRSFGADLTKRTFTSLTKRWEERSIPWCGALVTLPLVYLAFIALNCRRITAPEILCAVTALTLLASSVIPVEIPNPRYIVALGWMAFLLLGSMLSSFHWRPATHTVTPQSDRAAKPAAPATILKLSRQSPA